MFLRRTRSGPREYLQLAESYRTPAGVRQRVLFSFGRIDQLSAEQIETLVRGLQRVGGEERTALPAPSPRIACAPARSLGDTWVLTQLWKSLGLESALRRALGARRAVHEPWIRTMVFHRLCDPGSKLGTLRWLETAVMPGIATEQANHPALLRAMDALDEVTDALQTQVLKALRPLLDQELSVVFYDLTTVRAEGESDLPGDLRAVGHSKDRDLPARQVVIGVVQSACGLPLLHTVHKGNVSEASTLLGMVQALKARLAVKRVVIVADRGLMNHDQLDQLEAPELAVDYIMAVPARRYGEYAGHVQALGFAEDTTGIRETRDHAGRRLIVARDAERAQSMREHRAAALAEIETLAAERVGTLEAQERGERTRGRALSDGGVYHQIRSLIEDAGLGRIVKTHIANGLFSYSLDEAAMARAEALDGTLILVTRIDTLDAAAVVERYKALADIERGFRVLKQEIEIAPMYHRLPERIRAHAAICFLALVLHRHLRARLRARQRPESPERVLQQLRRIQAHQVTVDGTLHHATSAISAEHRTLCEQLELSLPDAQALPSPRTRQRRRQPPSTPQPAAAAV
ncbi:IS1634 family transposase [Metallibacterium scheffleri]|uniref:IS1634 family transposase n=1 Tax=Metallibacterium scheffleri TaxID=993689 RepID=UPI001B378ED2|nr:IS1634 family transposase [Metallibacterium scheffleri]